VTSHLRRVLPPQPGSGRRHRGGQDHAAVSAGELLRRTLRPDRPNRGLGPNADLRISAPPSGACRVRRALQHRASASSAAVVAAAASIAGSLAG